jgi:hypothetical protein
MDLISFAVGAVAGAAVGVFVPSVYAKLTSAKASVVAEVAKVEAVGTAVAADAKKL